MRNLMPPVNTPDKLFHDGDPTQGIEGTIVTAEFMNNHQAATRDLQQEVINVLKEAGVTPDPEKQNQLVEALTSFIGQKVPDASLTQKGVVQLNSAVNSESETEAATPKAVKIAMDNANARLAKDRNGADIPNKQLFLDNIGGAPKTRKINNMPLTSDITINNISGNAGTATRLQTARRINNVLFDGTSDITISSTDSGAVRDFRYTSEVFHNPGGNEISWVFRAPSGCILSGINVQDTGRSSADNIGGVYYKQTQIYINGGWRTVSG
ncbi:tail fiber protein [Escherichia coli]|uniref:phage tail protein n=1 Tax=Escherichia coli TaxID=562 RepID=UPI0018119F66|nr:tail fiber protein [Escherichia coli]EFG6526698.1 phage tail protein [Escherichia coli]EIQ9201450.1 tail fiber protein [Escherichia coli]EJX1078517.1 tail fiber protein [Escherichia coli]HAO9524972.1 phage tail protein [Escherichia coli]HBE4561221.1 tail fiber protein [Escherichia coli]